MLARGVVLRSRGRASRACLFAEPVRLALVEKRVQSFTEILAHVAHEDQVLTFLTGELPLQAGQRLFGGVERQRCMPGNN